ncbi:MAG: adenylate kinase [Thermoplasmata archaeon]
MKGYKRPAVRRLVKVVLLGPPGVGKGTQARRLSEILGVPRIITGDMLRRHVASDTPLGRKARGFMERGELVPDDLIIAMIRERLEEEDARGGFVIDGFPRTVAQAEAFETHVAPDVVVALEAAEEELIERLSGRRVCRKCQAVYHLVHDPPRRAGFCDRCGGELVHRADDTEEVIRERLRAYRRETEPLVHRYAAKGLLERVRSEGGIGEVTRKLQAVLQDRGLA